MGIEQVESDVDVVPRRPTIVTALPLERAARQRLADRLRARVVDVREPVDHADLVLSPSCSPQLLGRLSDKYGGARVVVVELDDWEFDIDLGGPVKRVLRGGAAGYVLADSIDELADKLAAGHHDEPAAERSPGPGELPSTAIVDDLVAGLLAQSTDSSVHVLAPEE